MAESKAIQAKIMQASEPLQSSVQKHTKAETGPEVTTKKQGIPRSPAR